MATALWLVAFFTTACGSSPSATGSSTTTTSPSPAASKAAITKSFETLFDLANPAVAPKIAVVQDGSVLQATFTKMLASSLAKSATGAKVLSVTLYSSRTVCSNELLKPPCGKVVFDILGVKQKPILTSTVGWAVYSGGRWLVDKATICGLLSLASTTPLAGC
jgi:hypothetical protein